MALLHYTDNEVPAFAEWDETVADGASTLEQTAAASFPDRGALGLRVTIDADSQAYAGRTLGDSLASGKWFAVGWWWRVNALHTSSTLYPMGLKGSTGNDYDFCAALYPAGGIKLFCKEDSSSFRAAGPIASSLCDGRWHYVVAALKRASAPGANDGAVRLYIDGLLRGKATGIDNDWRFSSISYLKLGAPMGPRDGYDADLDEVKIAINADTATDAMADVEPFAPQPAADLADHPERTAVLYRAASDDSAAFAAYVCEQFGVPLANRVPLPNASSDETLADYATFQAQVEDDLAAWLANNPVAAERITTLLIGYGVPGYFMHAGIRRSASSRLMRFGQAFSARTVNPLYATKSRPSIFDLRSSNCYCSTRIDADTLQHAKDLLDAGLAVSTLSTLPVSDKLFTDEPDSLILQHTRLERVGLGELTGDAFAFGDLGSPVYGAAGTRAVLVDRSSGSADTLRAASVLFTACVANGYAAGMGFPADAGEFDTEAFLEILRVGGSFAEAALCATRYLDDTAVHVGAPMMTVAFPRAGFDLFRGEGAPEEIDYASPAAYLRAGQTEIDLPRQQLGPSTQYFYAARAVAASGTPERNTHALARVAVDGDGQLLPPPPPTPEDLAARTVADGNVLLTFSCVAGPGHARPDAFEVFSDDGTGVIDLGAPAAVLVGFAPGETDFETTVSPASLPALLAVRAVADGRGSGLSEVVTVRNEPEPQPAAVL